MGGQDGGCKSCDDLLELNLSGHDGGCNYCDRLVDLNV